VIELIEPLTRSEHRTSAPVKIEVRDLDFFYGTTQALKNVSLSVPAHAVTAIARPMSRSPEHILQLLEGLGLVLGEVDADLVHRGDGEAVDFAGPDAD